MQKIWIDHRLLHYRSYSERWWETTKGYDWSNPMEAIAGATHVVTSLGGIDAVARDGLRAVDGGAENVPAFSGHFARTRRNISDLFGNIVRVKPLSAVGTLINAVGDGIADTADSLSGAAQRRSA